MPISATGSRRWSASAGVSLVEVLVALLIASMVAGAAMLIAPSPTRTQHQAVRQFAARLGAASDESILINRKIALSISSEGYGFERLETGGWAAFPGSDVFTFRPWPAGLTPRDVGASDDATATERVVIFDPVGGANPARLELVGANAGWVVQIDSAGVIHVDPAK